MPRQHHSPSPCPRSSASVSFERFDNEEGAEIYELILRRDRSLSIPFLMKPYEMGEGESYIDGAIFDNFPLKVSPTRTRHILRHTLDPRPLNMNQLLGRPSTDGIYRRASGPSSPRYLRRTTPKL